MCVKPLRGNETFERTRGSEKPCLLNLLHVRRACSCVQVHLSAGTVYVYGVSPVGGAVGRGGLQLQRGQHLFLPALRKAAGVVVELMVQRGVGRQWTTVHYRPGSL